MSQRDHQTDEWQPAVRGGYRPIGVRYTPSVAVCWPVGCCRLELAAVAQAPDAGVGRAARAVRRVRRAAAGRRALHPVRLPRVHGARAGAAPHGGPLHAGRALLAALAAQRAAHAEGRHRHAHPRLPNLG